MMLPRIDESLFIADGSVTEPRRNPGSAQAAYPRCR